MLDLDLAKNWKYFLTLIVPLILLPVYFIDDGSGNSQKFRCLYVILLMGYLWMFEAMPLAVTALLPVVLFPLFGLESTSKVVSNYMRDTGMMYIGGITLALGIERNGLHKRIALRLMLLIGVSPWRILLGVMMTTFVCSCWIVGSTAVTAMMIPIATGLVDSLPTNLDEEIRNKQRLYKLYLLAVGYSANIGGTAVIIGSVPNLIFKDIMELDNIGQIGTYTEINFATWMAFNMPIAALNLLLVWFYLGMLYLNRPKIFSFLSRFNLKKRKPKPDPPSRSGSLPELFPRNYSKNSVIGLYPTDNETDEVEARLSEIKAAQKIGQSLQEKYEALGPMLWKEISVSFLFAAAVILWFTRDPQIFKGWNNLMFPDGSYKVGDSSVAVAIVLLMFLIPQDFGCFRKGFTGERETLMTWRYIQDHFPWNVLLLVGGGFAISNGAEKTGLSLWIGEKLNSVENLDKPLVLLIVLLVVSVFTEITSNAATISLLTPLLIALSKRLAVHPLYLSFAGAIACQYAFILPTSNPSNALVFTAGNMKILDMVKPGFFLNFACLGVLYVGTLTWGNFLFNFSDYKYLELNITTFS